MTHQSENATRLPVEICQLADFRELADFERHLSDVWLVVPPFGRRFDDADRCPDWFHQLHEFATGLGPNALLAILTSPEDAAVTWPKLSKLLRFQLWVAVKLSQPIPGESSRLPEHHAALLILSKYRSPLRHTKTRVAYTFCPACDKTSKDYGGKKHTYHEFGTLLSDVWRDVSWSPDRVPVAVFERLADVFGKSPHRRLKVVMLTKDPQLKPAVTEGQSRNSKPSRSARNGRKLQSRLIQGDCLEVLRGLPEDSVDFCFADPPYNLAKHYDNWDDAIDIVKYFDWCDRWLDELTRVLKPGRTCAILNIPQWVIRHITHLRTKLRFQNWIAWEGLSLPVRMIMPAHYSIVCFSKGAPRPLPGLVRTPASRLDADALSVLNEFYCLRASCREGRKFENFDDLGPLTDLWWDIHRLKHNSKRVDHPCQLPPSLMRRLIALFTSLEEMVLDPFNGAGTTSLCAEEMDRRFIGIEISERYHALALERHKLLRQGGNPFAKAKGVPNAKNSRVKRIGGISYAVPKKVLQLEVRGIARKLGRIPTRDEVQRLSQYPIKYFDEYFINWGEVCAAARTTGMKETRQSAHCPVRKKTEATLF